MTIIDGGDSAIPPTDTYDAGDAALPPVDIVDPEALFGQRQVTISISPTRMSAPVEIGLTSDRGLDVSVAASRTGLDAGSTRQRAAVAVDAERSLAPVGVQASRTRDRVQVEDTRQPTLVVGPTRKD